MGRERVGRKWAERKQYTDDVADKCLNILVWGNAGCLSGETLVDVRRGEKHEVRKMNLDDLYHRFNGTHRNAVKRWDLGIPTYIRSVNEENNIVQNQVMAVILKGRELTYDVQTVSGKSIRATKEHPFKTDDGFIKLKDLKVGDSVYTRKPFVKSKRKAKTLYTPEVNGVKYHPNGKDHKVNGCTYKRMNLPNLIVEAEMNGLEVKDYIDALKYDEEKSKEFVFIPEGLHVHHIDRNHDNNAISNLKVVTVEEHSRIHYYDTEKNPIPPSVVLDKIISIEEVLTETVYDIIMAEPYRNFVANDFCVHNSGKTHFIETAPHPFLINTDKGELTMHKSHIPFITIDGNMQVYETVMAVLDSARKKKDGFEEIETIGLDSIWKLSDLLLDEILEEAGNTGKAQHDQWGELLTRMSKIVDGFTALPYHFIATSGEATRQDDMDKEERIVTFNFSGSYRNRVAYAFDFNLYFVAKKKGMSTQYLAYSQEENKRTAKSRVQMPRQIVDPSFDMIQSLVTAGLEEKTEKEQK